MREQKRLNAWINGAALRDIDNRIHVVNITENAPDQELTWADAPGRNGQRIMGRVRRSKQITIEFDIRELFNLADRAAIVDAVNAWARDGVLKASHRPHKQIRVLLTKPAELNGARDVTSSYTVEFTAAATPYWEAEEAVELHMTGASGGGALEIPGSAEAKPEIYITPTGGTLNTLSVSFGFYTMTFTGLGVSSGNTLAITHDDNGVLVIADPATSKLEKRTAESADDFSAAPGYTVASYTANTACKAVFAVRGCYL